MTLASVAKVGGMGMANTGNWALSKVASGESFVETSFPARYSSYCVLVNLSGVATGKSIEGDVENQKFGVGGQSQVFPKKKTPPLLFKNRTMDLTCDLQYLPNLSPGPLRLLPEELEEK